jgi:hypothetical protein
MGETFIFEKVAHLCAPGEDELCYVFDDFGLFFR